MAGQQKALTKLVVERTEPDPARDRFFWDSKVPGFGVRIYPTGKRMYVFQYRTKARQQRRVAIGLHGPLTIEAARQFAADLYEAVRKGGDPAEEQKRDARRVPDTIEKVIEEFMLRYMAGKQRAPRYIEETRRNFDKHVLPRWRGRDLGAITRRDVIELLDAIVDEGKPVAANRALAAIRKLFNWGATAGSHRSDPCRAGRDAWCRKEAGAHPRRGRHPGGLGGVRWARLPLRPILQDGARPHIGAAARGNCPG